MIWMKVHDFDNSNANTQIIVRVEEEQERTVFCLTISPTIYHTLLEFIEIEIVNYF